MADILPYGDNGGKTNRLANTGAQELPHNREAGREGNVEDKRSNHNPFRSPDEAHL